MSECAWTDCSNIVGESQETKSPEIQEIDIQETTMAFDKLNFFENIKSEAAGTILLCCDFNLL
jgi:hypothetical protein